MLGIVARSMNAGPTDRASKLIGDLEREVTRLADDGDPARTGGTLGLPVRCQATSDAVSHVPRCSTLSGRSECGIPTSGQPWRLRGGETADVVDLDGFRTFARASFVLTATSFELEALGGGTRLSIETRIHPTDAATRPSVPALLMGDPRRLRAGPPRHAARRRTHQHRPDRAVLSLVTLSTAARRRLHSSPAGRGLPSGPMTTP